MKPWKGDHREELAMGSCYAQSCFTARALPPEGIVSAKDIQL